MKNTLRIFHRKDVISPCFNCTERHVGCHSDCEKYQAWSSNNYEQWHKARNAYIPERRLNEFVIQNIQKTKKQRRLR